MYEFLRTTGTARYFYAHTTGILFPHAEHIAREIPRNAIVTIDTDGDIIIFDKFPRHYKGTNPIVHAWVYRTDLQSWHDDYWSNESSRTAYREYQKGGYKRIQYSERIPENTVVRKHKSGIFRHKPSQRNQGEIALNCGECIIARTFNTGATISYKE